MLGGVRRGFFLEQKVSCDTAKHFVKSPARVHWWFLFSPNTGRRRDEDAALRAPLTLNQQPEALELSAPIWLMIEATRRSKPGWILVSFSSS